MTKNQYNSKMPVHSKDSRLVNFKMMVTTESSPAITLLP